MLKFEAMQLRIEGDPSPEAWKRVQRYASWMRGVRVDERSHVVGDALYKLCFSSPAGGWFPALQDLSWCIVESNLPYVDLFVSPHLKKIYIYPPLWWIIPGIPPNHLAVIASTIIALPTSVLQSLCVDIRRAIPPTYLKDFLSSVVLRCGPSLVEFTSPIPLSNAATNHLIRLPHLHT